jgi:hypothetical protein
VRLLRGLGDLLLVVLASPLLLVWALWAWKQRRFERNLDVTYFGRAVAGKFKDGRKTPHPWLRIGAEARHLRTGAMYYMVQVSGAHSLDWIKASEIDLYPEEPSS